MATTTAVKPLVSRGYGKIALLTLIAIGIGCALMGYEVFVEYGGATAAPKSPAKKISGSLPPPERVAPVPPPGNNPPPMPPPPMAGME